MALIDDASDRITLKEIIETYLCQVEGFVNVGDPKENGIQYHVKMIMHDLGYHLPQAPVSKRGDGNSAMLMISAAPGIPTISTILLAYLICLYQTKHEHDQFPSGTELDDAIHDMLLTMRVDGPARLVDDSCPREEPEMLSIEDIVRAILTQRPGLKSAFEESPDQDTIVDHAIECLLWGTEPSSIVPKGLSDWFEQLTLMNLFAHYCLGHKSLVCKWKWMEAHVAMMDSVSFAKPQVSPTRG